VSYTPNEALRSAREGARLTQGQLADLVKDMIERETGKECPIDADYVGKLERGVHTWPNQRYRLAFRAVLRASSDAELGFFSARGRGSTVVTVPHSVTGGDDVERKTFLRVLAGSVAGLAFTDPLGEFGAVAAAANGRRVGQTEVAQVRRLARMFADQDHTVGSGLSAQAAVAQLSSSAGMLESRFDSELVRARLFAAVAELADIAAGMCLDSGEHRQAERCFRFAVGCATEARDWAMRAKALSGLANLAVSQERPDDALSFAELSLVRADRLTPIVRSVMHNRHARALGLNGQERTQDCVTAVRLAEERFAAGSVDNEPEWMRYYTGAHLERDLGRALLNLAVTGGDYAEAQQRLTTALDRFPAQRSRGKTLATANLAYLTMARDDPMHAVDLGNEALDAVENAVRSNRVFDTLRKVRDAAGQYRDIQAVQELTRRIDLALVAV
jgi:tetratricopeptide (TPR) repeat protein